MPPAKRYYPMFVDLCGRPALVVGAGRVGSRKARTLAACGALVTVVSERIDGEIEETGQPITLIRRGYREQDLQGMFLVVAATDNPAVNQRILHDAEQRGILCNVVDRPRDSHFIVPATVTRGDLTLAISTAGASPALARRLRRQLEQQFGPVYGQLLELMKAIRRRLLAESRDSEANRRRLHLLLDAGLLEMIETGQTQRIDELLQTHFGGQWRYADLINDTAATADNHCRETK